MLCAPGPGHEVVDAGGGPEVDELDEDVGQIGLRVDVVELAALDQRGDASPVRGSLVMSGEECVLTIEHDGAFIVHLIFKCLETLEVAPSIRSDTGVPSG